MVSFHRAIKLHGLIIISDSTVHRFREIIKGLAKKEKKEGEEERQHETMRPRPRG